MITDGKTFGRLKTQKTNQQYTNYDNFFNIFKRFDDMIPFKIVNYKYYMKHNNIDNILK